MSKQDTIISLLKEIDENIDNVSIGGNVPKVKVKTFVINNACLNEDGRWDGESLIDTSECTNLERVANDCGNLIGLDVSDWDTSNVITLLYSFTACRKLEYFPCRNWDVGKCTNFFGMFQYDNRLKTIDVSNWDMSSATNIGSMFLRSGLQLLDLTKWNVHNVTKITGMFGSCDYLQSVIGNRTIDDVLANDIRVLNGLKLSLNVIDTILDRASLRAIINGLADLTGSDTQTLTLGETLIAKLTEEDITVATAKNWTIA